MKRVLAAAGLLLGTIFAAAPASAQTGTMRGAVVDTAKQGIADVKVILEFTGGVTRKFETKTNARGEFLQAGIPSGSYSIRFSKDGYRDFVLSWRVSSGNNELPQAVVLEKGTSGTEAEVVAKVQAAFKEAVSLTDAGKYDEAIAAYEKIQADQPNLKAVLMNLGFVYLQKKDFAAAEAQYAKVLDLEPDNNDAMLALASVYNAQGQTDKAKEMIDKAAAANPGDPKAQFKKGVFLRNANENDAAIQAFQSVIATDPNFADAYYNLGELMVGAGKFPEAVQYLEKYLTFNPTNQQQVTTAKGLIQALKK